MCLMLQIKLKLKAAPLPDASMQNHSHPFCCSPPLPDPRRTSPAPNPPLPPPHHSPHPLPGMCVCARVCFLHFTPSLTQLAHSSLLLPPLNLTSPHSHPPPPHPSARRQTTPDVGIQFVLSALFQLRFRFISCWLLLINSLDMRWVGEVGSRSGWGEGRDKNSSHPPMSYTGNHLPLRQ